MMVQLRQPVGVKWSAEGIQKAKITILFLARRHPVRTKIKSPVPREQDFMANIAYFVPVMICPILLPAETFADEEEIMLDAATAGSVCLQKLLEGLSAIARTNEMN